MSLTTPYATVEEYRDAINQSGPAGDFRIEAALLDASRVIDSGYGRAPGTFSAAGDASERVFDGNGKATLQVVDAMGVHAFTSVSAVTVDGTAVTGFELLPRNAASFEVAFERLALVTASSASLWTAGAGNVSITATWGFPAVPGPIRQLCIKIAHDLAEAHVAGPRGEIYMLDSGVTVRGDTWRLWNQIAALDWYARKVPAVA